MLQHAVHDITRTLAFSRTEKALGFAALCLIGPKAPVRPSDGRNALWWPVRLAVSKDPARAAQRDASSHWEGTKEDPFVITLAHVWTRGEFEAGKLKLVMNRMLLGDDPDMRQLNGSWIDMMEWEVAWEILLNDAVHELARKGEEVHAFDGDEKVRRIIRHMRGRVR